MFSFLKNLFRKKSSTEKQRDALKRNLENVKAENNAKLYEILKSIPLDRWNLDDTEEYEMYNGRDSLLNADFEYTTLSAFTKDGTEVQIEYSNMKHFSVMKGITETVPTEISIRILNGLGYTLEIDLLDQNDERRFYYFIKLANKIKKKYLSRRKKERKRGKMSSISTLEYEINYQKVLGKDLQKVN